MIIKPDVNQSANKCIVVVVVIVILVVICDFVGCWTKVNSSEQERLSLQQLFSAKRNGNTTKSIFQKIDTAFAMHRLNYR